MVMKNMDKKTFNFFTKNKLAVIWVIFGVLGRLIPHVPNITPMTGLSLFAGTNLSRKTAFLSLFLCLLVSDMGLAIALGYPVFSWWTIFTYSGFALIMFGGAKLKYSWRTLPFYLIGSALIFWLWTNFGVWLTSAIYAKSFPGLIACYVAALPFLRNAMLGDLIWGSVIFGSFAFARKTQKKCAAQQY